MDKCPFAYVTGGSREYLRLYRHYKNGYLFNGGGITDQPAHYLDAMSVLDSALNLENAKKMRKEGLN